MKRLSSLLSAVTMAMTILTAMPVQAATIQAGDLIKASGPAVYYYAQDGKRYVFPTEKTYFTWYANFSSVKTISNSDLSAIMIGGNVTYRPGTRLIKVTTDPRTYAVDGMNLRWVVSESAAKQIFGDDWAKQIDDLPDAFFVNYIAGADIDNPADFAPAAIKAQYPTIQTTLTSSSTPAPTPTPTPTPNPTPTPTSTTTSISITTDKSTAQPNESIYVLAQTSYTGLINKIELSSDDGLLTTCNSIISCSSNWIIPTLNTKAMYTFQAKLYTVDGQIVTAATTTTIVVSPISSSITLTADHSTVRSGEAPGIRALVGAGLTSKRTEIYVDGTSVKACVDTAAKDCRYTNYLFGNNGSTHQVYATVTTPSNLLYKSNPITITIGTNDSPMVTIETSLPSIYVGEYVDVMVTGQDNDGISQTQILKDGAVLKTCSGAAPCTIKTGPWNVAHGTVLTFTGTASDLLSATSTASATVTVQ